MPQEDENRPLMAIRWAQPLGAEWGSEGKLEGTGRKRERALGRAQIRREGN